MDLLASKEEVDKIYTNKIDHQKLSDRMTDDYTELN